MQFWDFEYELGIPISKKYILDQSVARAKVNSHLVEGISGIESIKSQCLEFTTETKWGTFYQKQIDANFSYSVVNSIAGSMNNFLQQISAIPSTNWRKWKC